MKVFWKTLAACAVFLMALAGATERVITVEELPGVSDTIRQNVKHILTKDVLFIMKCLKDHGYEGRVVGGAVRNLVMGTSTSDTDIDIASTAPHDVVTKIFESENCTVRQTGDVHGTVTVVLNGEGYEITTLRIDKKTDGRKAIVEQTDSFELDSKRRDFTFNALYMGADGKIFDYNDGINDALLRRVKFIESAEKRIREDYLRIMRYFRFVARYGNFQCDEECLKIINSLKSNLSIISIQRILVELEKTFSSDDSYKMVAPMLPVLQEIFGLRCDPLKICHDLGIKLDSAKERLCMLLKFSDEAKIREKYKYNDNPPAYINDVLQFRCPSISEIKKSLKVKNAYANDTKTKALFVKYIVIQLYNDGKIPCKDGQIPLDAARALFTELTDFCNSKYSQFTFSKSDFAVDLRKQESNKKIGALMESTRKYWESKDDASEEDCIEFAKKFLIDNKERDFKNKKKTKISA
ncbi:MAG: hypothetical protein LBB25_02255 [Holosporaceae bacterium]|jgi:tRNA nucleotidyltransferase/poly(A) polymerase|nr:hypothetical protein [Holosporaceae bacterium]